MSIKTTLDAILKALEPIVSEPETREMTTEQLTAYVTEQVELAKSESDEDSKKRMSHLAKSLKDAVSKIADGSDSSSVELHIYRGEFQREKMTAAQSETEKTMSHAAAAGPAPGVQALIKSLEPMFKAGDARTALLAELSAMLEGVAPVAKADDKDRIKTGSVEPASTKKTEEAPKAAPWPRDLNADKIDREHDFGVDAGR